MSYKDLTTRQLEIIDRADVLVGGKRLLDLFKQFPARKKSIGKDIDGIVNFVRKEMKTNRVVVLASGDPMFFGIGRRLVSELGHRHTVVYPNVSSVAVAFARIREPWDDARVISLHGRKNEHLLFKALEEDGKIAVLTDNKHNPAWLAGRLLAKQFTNYKICVFEALGDETEKVGWYTLAQATGLEFGVPNMVILKRSSADREEKSPLNLGAPDNWFDHEKGLVTKSEIRAITLSKLRLSTGHVLWDLG
ncbi:MAG: precorrin-6y C5,15-methyltransferase (decarboxylating) subunit CbiE, partial [Desulfobacterales bacterium]